MIATVLLTVRAVRTGVGWGLAVCFVCFTIVCLAVPGLRARAVAHYRGRSPGTLVIDDTGVARAFEGGREAVTWDELTAVNVVSSSEGPYAEGVYFVLVGADGRACLVPYGLAESSALVPELERRLPDLDSRRVIAAVGSTEDGTFTIWSRRAP